jgi:hypothetical protein
MTAGTSRSRTGALLTLALSGVIGYYVGTRGFPEWQVPVESAQVLAGIVHYPPGNPFFIYHLKLWTLLHQVCAVLLSAGASEIRLSAVLSGITGMVSFQALAMTTYAFSRSTWWSIVAAIVIFVGRAADYGVRYPIFLLGTSHTYGSIGLSWLVLAAALIGCERYGAGLFLLGLAPAIHPSLGIWLALITAAAFAWDSRMTRAAILPRWRWFAAGALVSALSLAVHFWTSRGVPPVDSATATRYLSTFTALWDEHRQPMGFNNAGVVLNLAALVVGLLWLTFFKSVVPAASAFMLRFVAVSAAVSIACVAISHVSPEKLPGFLVVLMPTRVVNVDGMMFAAMILGVAAAYRMSIWGRMLVVAMIAGLLLNHQGLLSTRFEQTASIALEPRRLTLVVLLAGTGVLIGIAAWQQWTHGRFASAPFAARLAGDLAVIGITAAAVLPGLMHLPPRTETATFRDHTNDGLFATAARSSGMLLTGGDLHLVQLRTRRPVILDGGGLDGLPYAIAGAPETERILRDVYGIDFFHPPLEAHGIGMIPSSFNRNIWEGYSIDRWRAIRRAYNVTQVLTYNNWTLRLPIVAQNGSYLLYEIPE